MYNGIKWIKSFSLYQEALQDLNELSEISEERELLNIERKDIVDRFIYTHELACITLRDFLFRHNITEVDRLKDVTKESFKLGIITEAEEWINMIKSRNLTTEVYTEKTIYDVSHAVLTKYIFGFNSLDERLEDLKDKELVII